MCISAFLSTVAAGTPHRTTLDLNLPLRKDIGPFASGPSMSDKSPSLSRIVKKESAIFAGFLFVGKIVFGAYGGAGFAEFFGTLNGKIRSGDLVAWFLVLSPWLALQVLRLMVFGWRAVHKL